MKRRNFFRTMIAGGTSIVAAPIIKAAPVIVQSKTKPETNIETAKAIPRTTGSMPGKVTQITHNFTKHFYSF